jgi:hypothetical protein
MTAAKAKRVSHFEHKKANHGSLLRAAGKFGPRAEFGACAEFHDDALEILRTQYDDIDFPHSSTTPVFVEHVLSRVCSSALGSIPGPLPTGGPGKIPPGTVAAGVASRECHANPTATPVAARSPGRATG